MCTFGVTVMWSACGKYRKNALKLNLSHWTLHVNDYKWHSGCRVWLVIVQSWVLPYQRLSLWPWARNFTLVGWNWFVQGTNSSAIYICAECWFHNQTDTNKHNITLPMPSILAILPVLSTDKLFSPPTFLSTNFTILSWWSVVSQVDLTLVNTN